MEHRFETGWGHLENVKCENGKMAKLKSQLSIGLAFVCSGCTGSTPSVVEGSLGALNNGKLRKWETGKNEEPTQEWIGFFVFMESRNARFPEVVNTRREVVGKEPFDFLECSNHKARRLMRRRKLINRKVIRKFQIGNQVLLFKHNTPF